MFGFWAKWKIGEQEKFFYLKYITHYIFNEPSFLLQLLQWSVLWHKNKFNSVNYCSNSSKLFLLLLLFFFYVFQFMFNKVPNKNILVIFFVIKCLSHSGIRIRYENTANVQVREKDGF